MEMDAYRFFNVIVNTPYLDTVADKFGCTPYPSDVLLKLITSYVKLTMDNIPYHQSAPATQNERHLQSCAE